MQAGFITGDDLDEVVRRTQRALDTVVHLGLVSEETIRTVLSFELRLRHRDDESVERFIERVYEAMDGPKSAQSYHQKV
jgi:reverse gyrase